METNRSVMFTLFFIIKVEIQEVQKKYSKKSYNKKAIKTWFLDLDDFSSHVT